MDKEQKYKNRMFTYKQKGKCWGQAPVVPGRDPARWRYDPLGNPVLNSLRGCPGPLCHEYDHIHPYSKGGKTSTKNCQILQTKANRFKSNYFMTEEEMKTQQFFDMPITNEMMDMVEMATYGNISKSF